MKAVNEALRSAIMQQNILWGKFNKLQAICASSHSTPAQWEKRAEALEEWGKETDKNIKEFSANNLSAEYQRMLISGVIV